MELRSKLKSSVNGFQPIYLCQHSECDAKSPEILPVFHCVSCGVGYCDSCWQKVEPHKDPDLQHKKSDSGLTDLLYGILAPAERSVEQQQNLRQMDAHNLWFGVFEKDGRQFIHEGSVYEDLILTNPAIEPWHIYPGLVTFVGDTGKANLLIPKTIAPDWPKF